MVEASLLLKYLKVELPSVLLDQILVYYGYYKDRNGVLLKQINKRYKIYKLLSQKPLIQNSSVQLFVKSEVKNSNWHYKYIKLWYKNYFDNYEYEFPYGMNQMFIGEIYYKIE